MLFLQPDVVALVAILQGASPSSRFVWLLIVMAAEITESARREREREREGGRDRPFRKVIQLQLGLTSQPRPFIQIYHFLGTFRSILLLLSSPPPRKPFLQFQFNDALSLTTNDRPLPIVVVAVYCAIFKDILTKN